MKRYFSIFLLCLTISTASCSLASYGTQEGLLGGTLGAAAGSGVGYLIGQEIGKKTENVALAGGVGTALGLLGGAWLHEQNAMYSEESQVVKREAKLIESQQHEIDHLRTLINDSSSWGENDHHKTWDQRYLDEEPSLPYQGHVK